MSFYHFSQNNSGGDFVGPAIHVIVEASSAGEAIERAESVGLYFDGEGDCPCCGNRWSEPWGKPDPEPMIYSKSVDEHLLRGYTWETSGVPEVMIVRANGSQEVRRVAVPSGKDGK